MLVAASIAPLTNASIASAQVQNTGTVAGSVVTQEAGLAVAGAIVRLFRSGSQVAQTTTDANGAFSFASVEPGIYSASVSATGYEATQFNAIAVTPNTTATARIALLRARANGTVQYREIGRTTTTANQNAALAASSTIQYDVNPGQLSLLGQLKAADQLALVPGVNLSGSPHTVGDDTSLDIRGMGAGEVRPLLDGHPIGPIGVLSPDYFDYANSSYALLSNIQVTEGSGATGLYGADVIGGTIDFQTLNPTLTPEADVSQTFGNEGIGITVFKATGTLGKFGFALGHSVFGTYGDFQPGQRFQGARPNNNSNLPNGGACLGAQPDGSVIPDVTTCNQNLNTYSVSGNYRVQNDLGKIVYTFHPGTTLSFTAYASNQLSDSTGNGDNDYLPYDTRLAEIQTQTPTCGTNGYLAVTNSNPAACLSAQQLAAASYGPDGGGEDRNRGTSLQDFHGRFQTNLPANNHLTADIYQDYYDFRKNSNQAAGLDPTGTIFIGGGTYQDNYLTSGLFVADEIATANNDLGFGYSVEHQKESGNSLSFDSNYVGSYAQQSVLGSGDYALFLRDIFSAGRAFTAYFNAWDRRSITTQHTTFDPRLSLVFRPTSRDVLRVTYGHADGDPAAAVSIPGNLGSFGNPSSLNPSCSLLNSVATGGNSLTSESSNDYEAGYAHHFYADTQVQVVGYVSNVRNQLFNGVEPLLQYGAAAITNPVLAGEYAGFAQKINATCGTNYNAQTVQQVLGVSTVFNANNALFRGIEAQGRIRFTPRVYTDFTYNIQSAQQFGISDTTLASNPFLFNGGQIYEIPTHTGSATVDYNDQHGLEGQLEMNYVGNNNTYNRPPFVFFNAGLTKTIGKNSSIAISAANVFNQDSQIYGYFGHAELAPVNSFFPSATSSVQQAALLGNSTGLEEIGLPPATYQFTFSQRI